jgi:hypothetical protein
MEFNSVFATIPGRRPTGDDSSRRKASQKPKSPAETISGIHELRRADLPQTGVRPPLADRRPGSFPLRCAQDRQGRQVFFLGDLGDLDVPGLSWRPADRMPARTVRPRKRRTDPESAASRRAFTALRQWHEIKKDNANGPTEGRAKHAFHASGPERKMPGFQGQSP